MNSKTILIIFTLIVILVMGGLVAWTLLFDDGGEVPAVTQNQVNTSQSKTHPLKIVASEKGIYLGAYDFQNGIAAFEDSIGKKVAIAGFPSHGIFDKGVDAGEEGPLEIDIENREKAYQDGYITVYGFDYAIPSSYKSPQAVIDGVMDEDLKQVAQSIKDWGRPIFWNYQREPQIQPSPGNFEVGFDGGGYGPQGDETYAEVLKRNGDPKAEYGESSVLDGPERFVDAAKHIHDVVEGVASNQITWVMGAPVLYSKTTLEQENAANPDSEIPYTTYQDYYPGDDYVDWHAFDLYPWQNVVMSKDELIETMMTDIAAANSDKPVMLLEFGIDRSNADIGQSEWFSDFFENVFKQYPQIKAFIYWQMDGDYAKERIEPSFDVASIWEKDIKDRTDVWHSCVTLGDGTQAPPTCSKDPRKYSGPTQDDEEGGTADSIDLSDPNTCITSQGETGEKCDSLTKCSTSELFEGCCIQGTCDSN